MSRPIPVTDPKVSLKSLQGWMQAKSILGALESFHRELGDIFQINLPGFNPIMLVGPEANRFMLVTQRDAFLWRNENDPVTDLLRHGVLVEDGASHDMLRDLMNPALHKRQVEGYIAAMGRCTDSVLATWKPGDVHDMLGEMRKIALLILMETLFDEDFAPQVQALWQPILRAIEYISPGLWLLWRRAPRLRRYRQQVGSLNAYLYQLIQRRRQQGTGSDMLSLLIDAGLSDALIRDQLLTMLIAGHDTSTALLSWALYLLGSHPAAMQAAQAEVDAVLGAGMPDAAALRALRYLGWVNDETLRLYPPIHLGSRKAATAIDFQAYHIPAGSRVIYSIYLVQRDPRYWAQPAQFLPERFAARPQPYTYLPFGGGARNCIGVMFGQVEAKVVLARVLQQFELQLMPQRVHAHMGATLEPRPGVLMRVAARP